MASISDNQTSCYFSFMQSPAAVQLRMELLISRIIPDFQAGTAVYS